MQLLTFLRKSKSLTPRLTSCFPVYLRVPFTPMYRTGLTTTNWQWELSTASEWCGTARVPMGAASAIRHWPMAYIANCGGSVINSYYILAAAYCVVGYVWVEILLQYKPNSFSVSSPPLLLVLMFRTSFSFPPDSFFSLTFVLLFLIVILIF